MISAIIIIMIMAMVIIVSTAYAAGFMRLLKTPKRDIIETSETSANIIIAIYISCVYMLFLIIYALYIINKFQHLGWTLLEFIINILSVLPGFIIIYNYFNLNNLFKKRFGLKELSIGSSTEIFIQSISKALELKKAPMVMKSEHDNISPFVYGRTTSQSFIAIPKNWDDILGKISKGNEDIKQSLKKLTLAHELSHIKNRDHVFMGWSTITQRAIKYWIVLSFPIITLFAFWARPNNLRILLAPIILGITYYLLLYLLSMSVSRKRELLADARASVLLKADELNQITEPQSANKNQSYLDQLLQWFSIFSPKNLNTISISAPSNRFLTIIEDVFGRLFRSNALKERVIKIIKTPLRSHPDCLPRIEKLKQKFFIKRSQYIISNSTAIWLGMMLSLFYSVTQIFPLQILSLLPDFKSFRYTIAIIYSTGFIFYVFLIISLPFIFYFSLRNSIKPEISFKKYLKLLILRFLLVFISFFYFCLIITSILFLNHLDELWSWATFVALDKSNLFFWGMFIVAAIFSFLHFYEGDASNLFSDDYSKRLTNITDSLFFVLIFLVSSSFIILKPEIPALVFAFLFACLIFFMVGLKFPPLVDPEERIAIFGNSKYYVKIADRKILSAAVAYYTILLYLPFLVIIIATSFLNIYIGWVSVLGIFTLILLTAFAKRDSFKKSHLATSIYLESINRFTFIIDKINKDRLSESKVAIYQKILNLKLDDGAFTFCKTLNFGVMGTAHSAISSLLRISPESIPKDSKKWILGLENEDGGFLIAKEISPRLLSIYLALFVLKELELIGKIRSDNHSKWIKSLQTEHGYFWDKISKSPLPKQTFYALSSLNFIGKLDVIDKKKCLDWIMRETPKSKRSPETYYHFLKSLDILNELDEKQKEEIKNDWLLSAIPALKNTKVELNLSNFYYFYKIAELVYGGDGEKIRNLIPGIEEGVFKSFTYYLEKG